MQFSEPKQLTDLGGRCLEAVYSPDGRRIAFGYFVNKCTDIYMMNHDGTNLTKLTDGGQGEGEGAYGEPQFNHDGTQIVCLRSDAYYEERYEIYLMNTSGQGGNLLKEKLTAHSPCFSPDGQHIVYNRWADSAVEIFRMKADGSEQTRLTHTTIDRTKWKGPPPRNRKPRYSPDGQSIAFINLVKPEETHRGYGICRMRPDGSEQVRIADIKGFIDHYIWHPGSKHIAYSQDDKDADTGEWREDFYLADINSAEPRLFWTDDKRHWDMAFSPDGRYLAITASYRKHPDDKKSVANIYLLDLETNLTMPLTDSDARNIQPIFSPDGKTLLFASWHGDRRELYALDLTP